MVSKKQKQKHRDEAFIQMVLNARKREGYNWTRKDAIKFIRDTKEKSDEIKEKIYESIRQNDKRYKEDQGYVGEGIGGGIDETISYPIEETELIDKESRFKTEKEIPKELRIKDYKQKIKELEKENKDLKLQLLNINKRLSKLEKR